MKKIIFALLLLILGFNSIAYSKTMNHTKTEGKEETSIVVSSSQLKDTIASMENLGWEFKSMNYNKTDQTWTVNFVKYTKSGGTKIIGKNIQDGTYHSQSYNVKTKKEVIHTYVVKDNYIIKEYEDGHEVVYKTLNY